jgi:hypothetical protein
VSNVDLVLAWAAGRRVELWDVLRHERIRELHSGMVGALMLVPAPDGPVLASGSMDGIVRLWDPTTGDLVGELGGGGRGIWSLAVLRDLDGRVMLAAGSDAVRLWDPRTGELVHEYVGHTLWVTALAPLSVPGRGPVLPSASSAGSVRLWDPEDGQEITDEPWFAYGHVLAPFDLRWPGLACASDINDVDLLSLGPEPNRQLTWTRRIRLPRWIRLPRVIRLGRSSTGVPVNAMIEVALDGRRLLAAGCRDGTIRIWDLATGARLRQIAAHDGPVNALTALSTPDGATFLGSAGRDGFIRVWEPVSGRREGQLDAHPGTIYALLPVTLPGGTSCWPRPATTAWCASGTRSPARKSGSSPGTPTGCARLPLRDPLYQARSGYLYLVQHDVRDLLQDLAEAGSELVVFIDDLDRCAAATTRDVFEAISLFLSEDFPVARFVIGLDPVVVAAHVDDAFSTHASGEIRHADDPSAGWSYLRKLVQLPIRLPACPPRTTAGTSSKSTHGCARCCANGCSPSPTVRYASPSGCSRSGSSTPGCSTWWTR